MVGRYSRRSDLLHRLRKVYAQVQVVQTGPRDDVNYTPYRLEQRLDVAVQMKLVRDYETGTPTTQLTEAYRLSKASVLKLLREAGVAMRCQGLDEEQTVEAIRLYRSGLSLVRVGAQVGFGPTSVANALRGAGVRLRGRHDWRS